ncbi:predicted protein [Arabidopsis lyrata subsp. lyrata]|uniref:Predicted protein n=1 Tax=Arabidopsis lyrata subsp. lyrata TaxID=81972 RepID=D7LPT0_ARALL|nr:predicted protein [Arabidopsis lyrata subsp. lyrata]EFH51708.1 predicted protein [Arabidopsis lyrata subsp. lyrata]
MFPPTGNFLQPFSHPTRILFLSSNRSFAFDKQQETSRSVTKASPFFLIFRLINS